MLFFLLAAIAAKCPSDSDIEPEHSNLRIVLTDSLEVVDNDGLLNVPTSIRELSDVIVSDASKCDRAFVLDPSLIRVDQPKEFSLATKIEKGGAKKTTHPKVISKSIGKHLDEVNVPEPFVKATGTSYRTPAQLQKWLASQAPNDSVVVYNPDGPEQYSLGKRTYPTFVAIEGVREYIRKVLCQNDKANFTLLYSPPVGTIPPPPPPPGPDTTKKPPRRRPIITVIPSGPKGICNPVTHSLHELIYDEDDQPQYGKVLVVNCKECGYTSNN